MAGRFKIEKEWVTKAGLKAKVLWVNNSHRCGYVAIPKENKYFQIDYDCLKVEVHGGLTYGTTEPDGEYWVGYDCAHLGDKTAYWNDGVLRTLEYCTDQCEKLAEQLK